MRALAVFLFPALELYLLVRVGAVLGAMSVVALVFASAALGIAVLRLYGRQSFFRVREDLSSGRMPQDILLDNLLIFFAGLLLIFPGFLSDIMGLLLLIPPLRTLFRSRLVAWLQSRQQGSGGGFRNGSVFIYRSGDFSQAPPSSKDDTVIDVSAEPTGDSAAGAAPEDKEDGPRGDGRR